MARKTVTATETESAARVERGVMLPRGDVFSDVAGQDGALRILRAALRHGRLSHAYLFLGPSGVGREMTARRLGAALLCTGRSPGMAPDEVCGECPSCRRVDRGLHPDVHVCLTEADAVRRGQSWDEERKPSTEIKVEQIRALREAMRMSAFEGGWRVAIIPAADRLRVEAANALLKTLEEPLPNSLLVLCAPDKGAVLETLRSRCQRINFSPLSIDQIQALVQARRGVTPEIARALAEQSEGSVGRALEEEPDAAAELRARAQEWLGALQEESPGQLLERAESLEADRDALDGLIRSLGRLAAQEAEALGGGARMRAQDARRAHQMLGLASAALLLRAELQRSGANVRLGLERFMLRQREAFTDSRTAQ